MSLDIVVVDSDFGELKYFGQCFHITERSGYGRTVEEKTVGYRYKLLSFSGVGKPVIVNVPNPVQLSIPIGSSVKLINPVVSVGAQRLDVQRVIATTVIWADDIVAVK